MELVLRDFRQEQRGDNYFPNILTSHLGHCLIIAGLALGCRFQP